MVLFQKVCKLVGRVKLKEQNLLKQKHTQSKVPYLWGVLFQLFKCYSSRANVVSDAVLQLVVDGFGSESDESVDIDQVGDVLDFGSLSDLCYTQICLQWMPLNRLPPFWHGRSIYDYMLQVYRTCAQHQMPKDAPKFLGSKEYAAAVLDNFREVLEKFTDNNFVEQWGSPHQAWPIQKKFGLRGKDRLGFPLPGSAVSTHREFYVLPAVVPNSVNKKWGGFRLLVSTVKLGAFLNNSARPIKDSWLQKEVHVLYYTDTHYGDDGEYEDLCVPGHSSAKPYYLLGVLEFLLLKGHLLKRIDLDKCGCYGEIRELAAILLQESLFAIEGNGKLYRQVCPSLIYMLLGVSPEELGMCLSPAFTKWIDRACAAPTGVNQIITAMINQMASVPDLISTAVCPICLQQIGRAQHCQLEDSEGVYRFCHKNCVVRQHPDRQFVLRLRGG